MPLSLSTYEQIVESLKMMIVRTKPDGTVTFVNNMLCSVSGKAREEFIGKSLLDCVPEESRERVRNILARIKKSPEKNNDIITQEHALRDEAEWIQWRVQAIFDDDDRLHEVQFIGTDVTGHKRTEETLKRRNSLLNTTNYCVQRLLRAERWQDEIENVLGYIGRAIDASRVYIFEFFVDEEGIKRSSQRFEWVAPGIEPQIGAPYLQNIPFEETPFDAWVKAIEKGVVLHGYVKNLAEEERFFFTEEIVAYIFMPFFVRGRLWVWVGFDIC